MGKSNTAKREAAKSTRIDQQGPKFRVKHIETGYYAYIGNGVPFEEAERLATGLQESEKYYLEEVI